MKLRPPRQRGGELDAAARLAAADRANAIERSAIYAWLAARAGALPDVPTTSPNPKGPQP